MPQLSPSILAADFADLKSDIKSIEKEGVKWLHIDVMDGHFVPNISFGMPVIKSIRKVTDMIFDVHIMISEPEKYAEDFSKAGADIINFHIEAVDNPFTVIDKIRSLDKKVGITLNPNTPVSAIEDVLGLVDLVLVMSVFPGFGGQKFIPETVEKVKELKKIRLEKSFNYVIEIDGGIDLSNVREVLDAGVDIVVAGSAVFGADDKGAAAKSFLEIFKEYD